MSLSIYLPETRSGSERIRDRVETTTQRIGKDHLLYLSIYLYTQGELTKTRIETEWIE